MSEHPTAAERGRIRAAKYYEAHRAEVLARRRAHYAHDEAHREAVKRRQRERYAAMKHAADTLRAQTAERAWQSFADFTQPTTTPEQ